MFFCFSNLQLIAAFSARQSAKIELKVGHAQTRINTHKAHTEAHSVLSCCCCNCSCCSWLVMIAFFVVVLVDDDHVDVCCGSCDVEITMQQNATHKTKWKTIWEIYWRILRVYSLARPECSAADAAAHWWTPCCPADAVPVPLPAKRKQCGIGTVNKNIIGG